MVICRRETEGEGATVKEDRANEVGHYPRITPGTLSLLGGQGCTVFRKITLKLFYSTRKLNPSFLGCEPRVPPLHHEGTLPRMTYAVWLAQLFFFCELNSVNLSVSVIQAFWLIRYFLFYSFIFVWCKECSGQGQQKLIEEKKSSEALLVWPHLLDQVQLTQTPDSYTDRQTDRQTVTQHLIHL